MFKKTLSLVLALVSIFSLACPAFAEETSYGFDEADVMDRITINFSDEDTSMLDITMDDNVSLHSEEITAFFENNELDIEYYMNWLANQNVDNMESVTITVLYPESGSAELLANSSDIQNHRFVYVDANYVLGQRTNQFTTGDLMANAVSEAITLVLDHYTKFIGTLASVFGITDPSSYFGTDRVRVGKEYYINDGASRVVTKFVELYAPVSGVVKWYAWGYAQSDYVRHGVQLYYKGLEVGSKQNRYHQYYTQRYYSDTNLYNAVANAYPYSTYEEIVDDFSASYLGYTIYNRSISREKYLEYDDIVTN